MLEFVPDFPANAPGSAASGGGRCTKGEAGRGLIPEFTRISYLSKR